MLLQGSRDLSKQSLVETLVNTITGYSSKNELLLTVEKQKNMAETYQKFKMVQNSLVISILLNQDSDVLRASMLLRSIISDEIYT